MPAHMKTAARPVPILPEQIRNSVNAALRAALDPKLGSRLGWLELGKHITARQFEAGERFAHLAREYARTLDAPRRTARTAILDRTFGRGIERPADPERVAEVRRTYETVRQRLKAVGAFEAVVATCMDDHMPRCCETLRKGLNTLAEFYRT
jgi:hypothetical protein